MALWFNQSKAKQAKIQANSVRPAVSAYHCVEVKSRYDACDAVIELQGKRFLSSDAPILPLPRCNEKCQCFFKHHEDRRNEERRDAFSASGIHYDGSKNRRLGSDRRRAKTGYSAVHY